MEHAKARPHNCTQCKKSFTHATYLEKHILRTHSGEWPLKCEICDKKFTHACHLKRHMMVHTGERPFKCLTCGKRFAHTFHLKLHMRTHTDEKPFMCKGCGRTFSRSSSLRRHEKTHQYVKIETPDSCCDCKETPSGPPTSIRASNLKHRRKSCATHRCETCHKTFAGSFELKRHMRIHAGERPFMCKECGKLFSQASHLTQHLRIHTGEKPYKCEICDRRFSQSSSLSRHTASHHIQKDCLKFEVPSTRDSTDIAQACREEGKALISNQLPLKFD